MGTLKGRSQKTRKKKELKELEPRGLGGQKNTSHRLLRLLPVEIHPISFEAVALALCNIQNIQSRSASKIVQNIAERIEAHSLNANHDGQRWRKHVELE